MGNANAAVMSPGKARSGRDSVSALMDSVRAKNPAEPEFHQAVQEAADSLGLVLDRHPEYRSAKILERIDRKSTRLNSSHIQKSRMPSSA